MKIAGNLPNINANGMHIKLAINREWVEKARKSKGFDFRMIIAPEA